MRGENLFIFVTAVLLSAGLIAAAWYFDASEVTPEPASKPFTPFADQDSMPEPARQSIDEASLKRLPPAGPGGLRKCTGPGGQLVITDQPSCEDLELKPGLSVIDAPEYRSLPERTARATSRPAPASPVRPRQRDLGKPPPQGLNVECRWLVGRAGEIERVLGEADVPAESIWKQDYCDVLREVRQAGCRVPSDQFYFAGLCSY